MISIGTNTSRMFLIDSQKNPVSLLLSSYIGIMDNLHGVVARSMITSYESTYMHCL